MSGQSDIVRRDFSQGKIAYSFQWNRGNHEALGRAEGDLASLWAHLTTISRGVIPEAPFTNPFYTRASSLRLEKMKTTAKTGFRNRLLKSGLVKSDIDHEIVRKLREYHRDRHEATYCAEHAILQDFLHRDPCTIAIEVPVWSERYKLSGHVDLLRAVDGMVQVCEYKPGPLDSAQDRFLSSLPQAAAYGEMVTHHLASTLHNALAGSLLPKVHCCIFDTHSSWHFGAEMFVTLEATGKINLP